ncbi:MAG: tRNA (adenosine(37)-N6)-threonylcarbamoyltransferase complex transferase subunit TsaD [Bacteroidetes bacterium]|nr:tRNA (adenosine(37)-N6)-threonylcarbamoyltransferase complex transferase subunit TsaD [Bacteroidota bacterium]
MKPNAAILGIETSCDDTAAAVVRDGKLLSSVVSTQLEHADWGGVVPELASRAHERAIVPVVDRALREAGLHRTDLDAVAVTIGPGLVGSLLVGVSFAKALSLGLGIPLVGVNHLDGHLASLFLEGQGPAFPHACLIVSGGHTQIMRVDAPGQTRLLGRTRDDAAGEAFDKVGKLLGLPYPGGPEIDRRAANGDPSFQAFPRTRLAGYDLSFSGIKTAVLYHLNAVPEEKRAAYMEQHMDDLCASFQEAVVDMLVAPVKKAMRDEGLQELGLVGGVSANSRLRNRLTELVSSWGGTLHVPPLAYCMDNAAMIAMAGFQLWREGVESPLTITADPSLALG